MISEPVKYVESLAHAGANQMSVHYEADLGNTDFCNIIRKYRAIKLINPKKWNASLISIKTKNDD